MKAVPTWYRGVRFRSTLEADWAATFDELDIYWQYEPVAIQLADGIGYLCDFYLPTQDVWAEVKGPHNERIEKVTAFNRIVGADPFDIRQPLVVILRPAGPGDMATWEGTSPSHDIVLAHCPECEADTFMDTAGAWQCRRCYYGGHPNRHDNKFWQCAHHRSGALPFTRAPRPDLPRTPWP